jgi:hypothetical protein
LDVVVVFGLGGAETTAALGPDVFGILPAAVILPEDAWFVFALSLSIAFWSEHGITLV